MKTIWVVEVNMKPTRKDLDFWVILAPTDGTPWKHATEAQALEYIESTRHGDWLYRARQLQEETEDDTMDSRLNEGRY